MIRPGSLGVSFSPTNDEQTQDAVGSPLQRAIQILSLRVPRVAGTRQPIPQSILAGSPTARMGGGSPMSAVVESVLRSLMGGQAPAGAAGPISGTGEAAGVGAPTVTPGIRERGNYPPIVPGQPPSPPRPGEWTPDPTQPRPRPVPGPGPQVPPPLGPAQNPFPMPGNRDPLEAMDRVFGRRPIRS